MAFDVAPYKGISGKLTAFVIGRTENNHPNRCATITRYYLKLLKRAPGMVANGTVQTVLV